APEPHQPLNPANQSGQPAPSPSSSPVAAHLKIVLFSEALEEYATEMQEAGKSADGITDVRLIVRFLIERLGDLPVPDFKGDLPKDLDRMLPDIPDRNNIPRGLSLAGRY